MTASCGDSQKISKLKLYFHFSSGQNCSIDFELHLNWYVLIHCDVASTFICSNITRLSNEKETWTSLICAFGCVKNALFYYDMQITKSMNGDGALTCSLSLIVKWTEIVYIQLICDLLTDLNAVFDIWRRVVQIQSNFKFIFVSVNFNWLCGFEYEFRCNHSPLFYARIL